MPVINIGSKFVTHATALTTTNDTDCYVVPANFSSHVEHLVIGNNSGSNRNYTLKYYQSSNTTTHTIFEAHQVSGKNFESIFTVDKPLFLHAGDKIIISADTADTITVIVSAEEFFDPSRQ
tara:strand:- start:3602 stop:3964 length:363 start_codon:yes stop_codon:yes gene_type:complete